jgi:hypothetical protein
MKARFDKQGNKLPDTGRGCGCQLCADAGAPRYERRSPADRPSIWSPLRRRVALALARVMSPDRSEVA